MAKNNELNLLVLCGGKGTRIKEISGEKPKSLLRLGDKTLLEIVLDNIWQRISLHTTFLLTGYKHEKIVSELQEKLEKQQRIQFVEEKSLLGTGGAVLNAMINIPNEKFLVINGDTIINADINEFVKFSQGAMADITILAIPSKPENDYGFINFDYTGKLLQFSEKSDKGLGYINSGIYFINKSILAKVPNEIERVLNEEMVSIEHDIFTNTEINIMVFEDVSGEFIDVGTPERYQNAYTLYSK